MLSKVSAFFSARPPDTTRLAAPSSGLSDLVNDVFTCVDGGSATSTGSSAVVFASLSPSVAAGNAVDRTVKNLIGIDEEARTVAIAFPAYMGRVNVVLLAAASCSRDVMSDTAGVSRIAAARGRIDFAEDECAETTCVKGESFDSRLSRRGDMVSGKGVEYAAEVECSKEVRPFSLVASDATPSVWLRNYLLLGFCDYAIELIGSADDQTCDLPAQLACSGQSRQRS